MVSSTAEANRDAPDRERMTRAPRKNSMPIVVVTKTQSIRQTSEKNSRTPSAKTTVPASKPTISSNPIGIFTLLKNGAPTLMREPDNHSENTGKRVPERTAMQDTSRIKLLNRKLDSRETIESSWFSLLR